MTASLLLVGESPPPGAASDFSPFDCASGTRLAGIMLGLRDRATLLEHVPRTNIFATPTGPKGCPPWEPVVARSNGQLLLHGTQSTTIVALGRKTAEALGMPVGVPDARINWAPPLLTTWRWGVGRVRGDGGITLIYAPHPSGASSTLNNPEVRADVRRALIPELVLGCPTLRPWHFRLDDPAILHILAAAVSPLRPALGAAALLWAADKHKTKHPAMFVWQRGEGFVPDPWDEPLINTARDLLRHDGGRVLAARWDPARAAAKQTQNAWLVRLAEDHAPLNAYPRDAMRATLARYAGAGLA